MTFAAPWALFLLVPWVATAIWVLLATRELAYVPFVRFWPKGEPVEAVRRSAHRPPMWVMTMLTAVLLAIFAAAGLSIAGGGRELTVVVDCGLSMSPPFRVLSCTSELHVTGADTIRIIPVPGMSFSWTGWVETSGMTYSAADTTAALDRTIRAALKDPGGQIAVLTDRKPTLTDPRLIWMRPSYELEDAGIDQFAVMELPGETAQAMVRVYNGSKLSRAALRVDAVEQSIELPPRGQTRDYFIDLPATGDVITARLLIQDYIAADNTAYLVRTAAWPKVDAASALPAALQRMLAVYTAQRPSSDASGHVIVSTSPPSEKETAAWLASAAANAPIAAGKLEVADHAVTRSIDWPALAKSARSQASPGAGWRVIASAGDTALVAVRETPVRQIWIGFDAPDFSARPDFVIFWTNVLDWLGGGRARYANEPATLSSVPLTPLEQADARIAASPGVYARADGSRIALSCITPRASFAEALPNIPNLPIAPAAKPLAAWLLGVALGLLALSLGLARRLTWGRHKLG